MNRSIHTPSISAAKTTNLIILAEGGGARGHLSGDLRGETPAHTPTATSNIFRTCSIEIWQIRMKGVVSSRIRHGVKERHKDRQMSRVSNTAILSSEVAHSIYH